MPLGTARSRMSTASRRSGKSALVRARAPRRHAREREFFIHNLLVRIHLIIEMILVDRPCAMGV